MFKKILVSLLLAVTPCFAQTGGGPGGGGATLPTATAAGQQLTATGPGPTYVAQSKISLDPRDFGADFTGASVADATTTSGSNVITCANADCNFPSNISGYIIFATAGTGSACLDNASITFGGALQTTVTGFTNANSITVSGTANTTATATACLAWFPKDSTSALTAWWTAGGCRGSYIVPPGLTLFSAPIMQPISGCPSASNGGLAYPGPSVFGAGVGVSFLVPAPVFTYTGLSGNQTTKCAVGNVNIEHYDNFAVFGLGERAQSTLTNVCLFMVGSATDAYRIDAVGWNARGGGNSLIGVNMIGITDVWETGGANYFGSFAMYFSSWAQTVLSSATSGNASGVNAICPVEIANGGVVTFINNTINGCVDIEPGGTLNSSGTNFAGQSGDSACIFANGGRVNLMGNDSLDIATFGGACTTGLVFSATGSTVAITNGAVKGITGAASNTFLDLGGNTFTGTTTVNSMTYNKVSLVAGP